MADEPILDVQVLDELQASVDGDRSFVIELIDAFLNDGATQIAAVDAAADAGDAETLVRPAHTLKSSSATLGAQRLSATARELEMSARSGAAGDATGELVSTLHAEWDSATAALRAWREEPG